MTIKKTILSALALLPLGVFAQNYTLDGQVGNLSAPAKAYLVQWNDAGEQVRDSVELNGGKFSFKGTVTEPGQGILYLAHKGEGINRQTDRLIVFLEPGTINIKSADSIAKATASGSKMTVDFLALNAKRQKVMAQMTKIQNASTTASAEEKLKMDKVWSKDYDAAQKELTAMDLGYVKSHPKSFLSLFALMGYVKSEPLSVTRPLFNGLSEEIRNSVQGKKLSEEFAKAEVTAIGVLAPMFKQTDTAGKLVSLSEFKGKYVLLDFWAGWCKPCRDDHPMMVKTYNTFKNKNFTILGISLDQPLGGNQWREAIAEDHLEWTQLSDLKGGGNEVALLYGINTIPQNFLIGPDGKIVAKNLYGDKLNEKLAELLNK